MINILVSNEHSGPTGLLAYRSRSVIKGTHTRVQASNSGALQMLLVATEGDDTTKKDD